MSATFIQTIEEGLEQTRQQASFNNQPDDLLIEDGAGTSLTRNSAACRNTGIHHVGLYAKDPAASAEFYRDIFGMKIVGGSEPGQPSGATAFLSSRQDEESHEIALFENRTFVHAAFKVASLAELRSLHARVVERNIEAKLVLDHGVSFAFYFADPDDNIIEVYWPTGVQGPRPQPYGAPLDLMQPDEILLRKIAPMSAEDGAGAKSSNETAPVPGRNQVECVPAGTDRTYKSPVDQIRFLLTGEQTGGAFFMAEVTVPPGSGNRPHIHEREDETFYLQQGTLTVHVGHKTLNALPGDLVKLPRGLKHNFQNNGNVDVKFLVVGSPAGFEKFFEESFYPAADWPHSMPPMNDEFVARVQTAAAKYGLKILPPA